MRLLTLLFAPILLVIASQTARGEDQPAPSKVSGDELASFVEQERQLLSRVHLFPIIVPRGERVGDNFDRETFTLIAGANDCFPGLEKVIRKEPGQLPSLLTFSERGLAAALGASGLVGNIEGGGGAKVVGAYTLSFRDVHLEGASIIQLRKAMPQKAAQECEVVRPYLQALATSKRVVTGPKILNTPPTRVATLTTENEQAKPPMVIAMVYYARRVLRVATSQTLDARAKASFGQKLLQNLGLGSFKVSAAGDSVGSNEVEFVGDAVIPVAYAAAFEVTGTKVAEGGKAIMQIAEITPKGINADVLAMETVLNKRGLVASSRSGDRYDSMFVYGPSRDLGTMY